MSNSDTQITQFDYLLNAYTLAAQDESPAKCGYGEKRRKLFDYVRRIERELAAANKRADAAEADAKRLRAENDEIAGLNHGQFLLLEYMRPILKSAKDLSDNAEEYDFADGLGQGALQEYWDALNTALEPATDAIYEEIDEAMRHD